MKQWQFEHDDKVKGAYLCQLKVGRGKYAEVYRAPNAGAVVAWVEEQLGYQDPEVEAPPEPAATLDEMEGAAV